jgi:hypothetical protein
MMHGNINVHSGAARADPPRRCGLRIGLLARICLPDVLVAVHRLRGPGLDDGAVFEAGDPVGVVKREDDVVETTVHAAENTMSVSESLDEPA